MAGKSSKVKNRRGSRSTMSHVDSDSAATSHDPVEDNLFSSESLKSAKIPPAAELDAAKAKGKESETANLGCQTKQGGGVLHLYPVSVKTQSGDKLELQLSPGDTVMDIRQFLLDAPETCFFTCYDLFLLTEDGSTHQLEDYNEISEVADITAGGCSLEMIAAPYDDRSIRAHVYRTKELCSLSSFYTSISTSLALEHEAAQKKASLAGFVKDDSSGLDGVGFMMEDVTGSLGKLLPSPPDEIKCVETIVFSSFNPPPSHRRLQGDLLYLDLITLEGSKYCITGTTKMFYVNSSTGNILDTRHSKSAFEATNLIGLLQKISSKFKNAFHQVLERKISAHAFENIQPLLSPNTWLRPFPIPDHRRDAARSDDVVTLSFGSELLGMQRDWNEELQSCKEFPHATPQERILRNKAQYKVASDFVDAAVSGAIGVISRCIPPINPTDPECFHMYVHNNIFFSFVVDGDLEQLFHKHNLDSDSKNNNTIYSTGASENVPNGSICGNGNVSSHEKSDENGRITSDEDEFPAGMQLAETEQATYASANNDLKGTKAYQEADTPGLYSLAMVIIDYRGHRVVAQSVLPGILQGDKTDSLLYGSIDNGKKICWNEDFHSKVLDAAKCLHLKEHPVLDGSGNVFKLAAAVESKGIMGSDDRRYLLDLMRVTPRDSNYTGPASRFCVLRPELISLFCQSQATPIYEHVPEEKAHVTAHSVKIAGVDDGLNSYTTVIKASTSVQGMMEKEMGENVNSCTAMHSGDPKSFDEIYFNPNVFTDFKLAGSLEEITADEDLVRKVSSYLVDAILPKFVQDLCMLEVSPMDGQMLTESLHAHGINVRYIGKVAEGTKHLLHLWDLICNEIIIRSAKHILKNLMRYTDDHDLAHSISHFFNSLFGTYKAAGTGIMGKLSFIRAQWNDRVAYQSLNKPVIGQTKRKLPSVRNTSSYMHFISSETLWFDIREFANFKYQFKLPEDARTNVKKVSVVRNLCRKVGIVIAARKYDMEMSSPFQASDILDIHPVVKHSIPICLHAKDLLDNGKDKLAEGMLGEAYALFCEASSILQQVTGPMHPEVANCCRYLAVVLYHAGDVAGALEQQQKELIINERCLGLDHPDTAHSYGNMALFYYGLNQTQLALQHMARVLLLMGLSSGHDHPDVAATFIHIAMMYQDMGNTATALRYLQEALKKNERLLGKEHVQTAICYHALAIAFNCEGAYKLSYQHEKKTYDILVKQLGKQDQRTLDSLNWLNTFRMREMQAQKQSGRVVSSWSSQEAINLLKTHPDLIQALKAAAAAAAGGGGESGNSASSNNRQPTMPIASGIMPRGRGVDERAVRAAAEIRKRAAARGVIFHPNGVPVQSPSSPLNKLLGLINMGMNPAAATTSEGHFVS